MKDCYCTYVLRSFVDGKLYIGYSTDLQTRFEAHQHGKVESTRHRRPFELIYYEVCTCQADAIAREKYFKTHYGRMFLYKRLKTYFTG